MKRSVYAILLMSLGTTSTIFAQHTLQESIDIYGTCAINHEDAPPPSKFENVLASSNYPGASVNFPVEGSVNALIVFVQRKDDHYEDCRRFLGYNNLGEPQFEPSIDYSYCENRPDMQDSWEINGVQSFTDNPLTEWPANLPDTWFDNSRQLPAWATGIIDPPNSTQITEGSLTDLYNRYSNGKFNFRGTVWPFTYIPEHNTPWYEANKGSMHSGLAKLNSEIINFIDDNHIAFGIDITPEIFDKYTNGDGEKLEADGNFDMLIVVYRFSSFRQLYKHGSDSLASAIAHLGGLGSANLTLGGMNIIDNHSSWSNSSGVVAVGTSQKRVLGVIMHEIGHRHFGGYHTYGNNLNLSNQDANSVMGGNRIHTFSGPDKIKLNWANIIERDITTYPWLHYTTITLHDGNKINDNNENEILWVKHGSNRAEGDIIIEARFKTSFMDKDPAELGLDGDGKDWSLPGNGLYIYKAHSFTPNRHRFSSMPNGALSGRRTYLGINDSDVVFDENSQYSPFTEVYFLFPESSNLDGKVAISHITFNETAGTISFRLWKDYPASASMQKRLNRFYKFSGNNVAKKSTWSLGGRFDLHDAYTISNTTLNGATSNWRGFDVYADGVVFDNVVINDLNDYGINIFGDAEIRNSEINVATGTNSMAVRTSGSSTTVYIANSILNSNARGLFATNHSLVYLYNNVINTGGLAMQTDLYSNVVTKPQPTGSNGLNQIYGTGLHAMNYSVNKTEYYNSFCTINSAHLEVDSGGIIWADFNYWPTWSGPSITNNGGTVHFYDMLGISDCQGVPLMMSQSFVSSAGYSDAEQGTLENVNITIQGLDTLSADKHSGELIYRLTLAIRSLNTAGISELAGYLSNRYHESTASLRWIYKLYAAQLYRVLDDINASESITSYLKKNWAEADLVIGMQSAYELADTDPDHALVLIDELEGRFSRSHGLQRFSALRGLAEMTARDYHADQEASGSVQQLSQTDNPVVHKNEEGLPADYTLTSYPNPFNPVTTIRYTLADRSNVVIEVFDVLGKRVNLLEQGVMEQGVYQVSFDGSSLASGIYLIRLRTGSTVLTHKIQLLK
jgi:M6 family metalloprotease-like protein